MKKEFTQYRITIEGEGPESDSYQKTVESRSAKWVKACASRLAREFMPPLTLEIWANGERVGRRFFKADGTAKNWTRY